MTNECPLCKKLLQNIGGSVVRCGNYNNCFLAKCVLGGIQDNEIKILIEQVDLLKKEGELEGYRRVISDSFSKKRDLIRKVIK